MKTLLRSGVPLGVALACVLPSPPLAAQVPDPQEELTHPWQVTARLRGGYLAPRWEAAGRALPKRPLAGVEVLVRPAFSRYGARFLLERTAGWDDAASPLRSPEANGIEAYQSVIADFVLYPVRHSEALPYVFAGGGFRTFAAAGSDVVFFPVPFVMGARRLALHAGVGIEVPVKRFLLVMEVGDYYGEILDFGVVHDLHISMTVGYTGFGALFKSVFADRSEGQRRIGGDDRDWKDGR